MNILYINPSLRPESRVRYFPLGAGFIVSSLTRAGYAVTLADMDIGSLGLEQVVEMARSTPYDMVMMGSIVTGYKTIKEITRRIRNVLPKACIVVGNSVASSIPLQLLTNTEADIAVLGEGDITAVELATALSEGRDCRQVAGIAYMADGQLRMSPRRPVIKDISALPMIDYDLFNTEAYLKATCNAVVEPFPRPFEEIRPFAINTARGCIADCTFCYHVFKGEAYRYRSEEALITETRYLAERYGVNYVFFHDDLSLFSKPRAQRLAETILGSGLDFHWWGTCRAGLFTSEEDLPLLRDLKRSGCVGLGYSLENADPGILAAMNKHITPEQFVRQAELLEAAGLCNYTSLVFGYPEETEATIALTIDTCIRARVCPSAGYLLPLPGSKMYDYCLEKGLITDEDQYLMRLGDRQDLRLNLTRMSDEEFTGCVNRHLSRLYTALGIQSESEDLLRNERYKAASSVDGAQCEAGRLPAGNRE